MSGFGAFLDPGRAFDEQQSVECVPMGREPGEHFVQRSQCPGDERVERADFEHLFGPRCVDGNRASQLADHRFDGPGFLLRRFAEADRQVGPQDRQHDARHAAAGAHVEHALACSSSWLSW